jgi:hypothetical protein
MFGVGLAVVASLPAAVPAEDLPAPVLPAAPAPEASASGKVFPRLHPHAAVQWVGGLGFLLLLLRNACRR